MITIKLPYTVSPSASEEFQTKLLEVRKNYSNVVRFAYNRYLDGLDQVEIRKRVKLMNGNNLQSFVETCAILEGCQLYNRFKNKSNIIFGGKFNFVQLIKGKITKEEFQSKRLLPLNIQGDKRVNGNRNIELNIINENFITFKFNRKDHFILHLPKLSKNYKKKLYQLELLAKQQQIVYSIKLTEKEICFSFEEPNKQIVNLNKNRYIGIDLNPTNIGISIHEYNPKTNESVIINTKQYEFETLVNKIINSKTASDDDKTKHLNDKLKFEILQISKNISEVAKHYGCKFVFIEDLKFKQTKQIKGIDKKSKGFNRLTKNIWKRDLFVQNLEKRLDLLSIVMFKVNPIYTSVIGNLQYDFVDAVNASIEIARRGFNVIILKNKQFYPLVKLKSSVEHQWKKTASETPDSWKRVFKQLKNLGIKYRVSLIDVLHPYEVFSLNNCKQSGVKMYNFDFSLCLLC